MTDVLIKRELLPCPFCYPHPACDEYPPHVTQEIADSGAWCVHAPCCDFYGPLSRTMEDAAHKWNTRATPAASQQVDGLEVVGYTAQQDLDWQGDCTLRKTAMLDYDIALCRLSDAQRAIAELREERERLQRAEKNDAIAYRAVLERQEELMLDRDTLLQKLAESDTRFMI